MHYRPGHFWLAQAPDVREVRRIDKRCTIDGVMFSVGDYLVRIGRYFDRGACQRRGSAARTRMYARDLHARTRAPQSRVTRAA